MSNSQLTKRAVVLVGKLVSHPKEGLLELDHRCCHQVLVNIHHCSGHRVQLGCVLLRDLYRQREDIGQRPNDLSQSTTVSAS